MIGEPVRELITPAGGDEAEMDGIDDGGKDGRGDLMKKLDDDMAIRVLQYLDTTCDVANASSVSRSWRRYVREAQLWKGLCLKEFPEVTMFEEVREIDRSMMDQQPASSSGPSSFKQHLEKDERIYRYFFQKLKEKPVFGCIHEAVCASSTDNFPEESIVQTLYPRPRYEQTPSYWSSTGQGDANCPETLTYKLVSPLCVVHEVCIRPFQGVSVGFCSATSTFPAINSMISGSAAFFQRDQPIYSAMHVRFRLGHVIKSTNCDHDSATGEDYFWTYESEKFPMEQVDSMQVFKLPRPVLCIGGILQVELLGRVQTQEMDQLYYICICHVGVVGRPLSDFKAHFSACQCKFWLEYRGKYNRDEKGVDGLDNFLLPEGENGTGSWMCYDHARQSRASRYLYQNPELLNAFFGNIRMANYLNQAHGEDSSSIEESDLEDSEEEIDEDEEVLL